MSLTRKEIKKDMSYDKQYYREDARFLAWRCEFMPTPAQECAKHDAIDHSLRKYIGLRKANLSKYELFLYSGQIYDRATGRCVMRISSENCALCMHYRCGKAADACPLKYCTFNQEHWRAFLQDNTPEPMIEALHKIKQRQRSRELIEESYYTSDKPRDDVEFLQDKVSGPKKLNARSVYVIDAGQYWSVNIDDMSGIRSELFRIFKISDTYIFRCPNVNLNIGLALDHNYKVLVD